MRVRLGKISFPLMSPADDGAGTGGGDAAAKAAADTAAADKAVADKAAADKAAADAAAGGKTPEQLAADKAAADTETARKAAEQAKAPEKYELKLPENSTRLNDADLQFVAAEAKALGLTNEQAQTLVNARETQLVAQADAFLADAKADPEIGGTKFDETVKFAVAGRDWLFPSESARNFINAWFDRTGAGNHKELLRALARIGRANAEDTPVSGQPAGGGAKKSAEETLYDGPKVK